VPQDQPRIPEAIRDRALIILRIATIDLFATAHSLGVAPWQGTAMRTGAG
jgi:hypothetical protein